MNLWVCYDLALLRGAILDVSLKLQESIARYLAELEEADSAETGPATPRVDHLTERLASLRGRLGELEEIGRRLQAAPDEQISRTDPDGGPWRPEATIAASLATTSRRP